MTLQGSLVPLWMFLPMLILASVIGAMAANDVTYYDGSALTGCNSEGIYFVSNYDGNQVQAFKAQSGDLIGSVLPSNGSYNLANPNIFGPLGVSNTAVSGPNGIVIYNEVLYLVNQNIGTNYNGSVMAFAVPDGIKFGKVEASQLPFRRLFPDPIDVFAEYSPYAPRGLVIGGTGPALFVADAGPAGGSAGQVIVISPTPPYTFIGTVNTAGIPVAYDFSNASLGIGPQGLVIGPEDGLLYVTIKSFRGFSDFDNNFGAILRFDVSILPGTFKDIFATTLGATDCSQFLHRPEGITWGPAKGLYKERLLYVTGYTDVEQNTPSVNNEALGANDKVLMYTPAGKCVDYFITEQANVLAQGLRTQTVAPIFGPKGDLYIPISSIVNGPAANNFTGGYRKYTVPNANLFKKTTINNHTLDFETTVTPNLVGGPLAAPFYSTFGRSDPGTLEYLCLV